MRQLVQIAFKPRSSTEYLRLQNSGSLRPRTVQRWRLVLCSITAIPAGRVAVIIRPLAGIQTANTTRLLQRCPAPRRHSIVASSRSCLVRSAAAWLGLSHLAPRQYAASEETMFWGMPGRWSWPAETRCCACGGWATLKDASGVGSLYHAVYLTLGFECIG